MEPNQYNYRGPWNEYFSALFRENFTAYHVKEERLSGISAYMTLLYRFYAADGSNVLVVQVMSQNSSSNRVQRDCESKGIRYLRFYHDHPGWWNTYRYVVARVKGALGQI